MSAKTDDEYAVFDMARSKRSLTSAAKTREGRGDEKIEDGTKRVPVRSSRRANRR